MYKSYLLRLWRDDHPGAVWHVTLEGITEPGEGQHFADLDQFVAYLLTAILDSSRPPLAGNTALKVMPTEETPPSARGDSGVSPM